MCREIDISLDRLTWLFRYKETYRKAPLPTIYEKRGWKIIYDKKQTDDFVEAVKEFESEHMDIFEVSEHLSVSLSTLYRTTKTNIVFSVPLHNAEKVDGLWWWKRAEVIECRKNIHDVGRDIA